MNVTTTIEPRTEPQKVVMSFFEALGDQEALSAVFAPDATWTCWGDFPISGTHTGREAVLVDFHEAASKLFSPDHEGVLEVTALIGDGPTVAAEFNFRTVTALGRQYHNHYVEVFEVAGTQITHVREYMDTQHLGSVCY
jgi:uncharacterized protein